MAIDGGVRWYQSVVARGGGRTWCRDVVVEGGAKERWHRMGPRDGGPRWWSEVVTVCVFRRCWLGGVASGGGKRW